MDDELLDKHGQNLDLLRLDEVVDYLELSDPRLARVAELRLFGGLTTTETAEVLGVSPSTIESDWSKARSWVIQALQNSDHHSRSVAFGFVSRFNTLRHLRPAGVTASA
jgi:DNA-directed RNA polymerase specialized sigma24 family protein